MIMNKTTLILFHTLNITSELLYIIYQTLVHCVVLCIMAYSGYTTHIKPLVAKLSIYMMEVYSNRRHILTKLSYQRDDMLFTLNTFRNQVSSQFVL